MPIPRPLPPPSTHADRDPGGAAAALGATVIALALGLLSPSRAHAQAAAVEVPAAQGVEVTGVKNPALMPYRTAYELATGALQAAGGHAALVIRVTSSQTHAPLPGLRLRIVGDDADAPVPVSADGIVDLPLDAAWSAQGADIVANQPKKSLQVEINVVPRLAAGALRLEDVVAATSAAQAALARIVPWYARLVLPSVHGVGLCYRDAGRSVVVAGEARPAAEVATDTTGVTVHCANFSAKEAKGRREAVLEAPEGWQALYW